VANLFPEFHGKAEEKKKSDGFFMIKETEDFYPMFA